MSGRDRASVWLVKERRKAGRRHESLGDKRRLIESSKICLSLRMPNTQRCLYDLRPLFMDLLPLRGAIHI